MKQMITDQKYQAFVYDEDGFVLTREDLVSFTEDDDIESPPYELLIVKDSALPVPQSDDPEEEFFRGPGVYSSDDVISEWDVAWDSPEKLLRRYDEAVVLAEKMSAE